MAPLNDLKILITAGEAYPAFEEAVLGARHRIDMGFRVFDPCTRLRSEAAREIGETWVDLLVSKLDEGVQINLALSDFDPIVRAELHRGSWKSQCVMAGVGELTRNPHLLDVRVLDHPSRVGWGPRLVLWPQVNGQIAETCEALNKLAPERRLHALRCMPRLSPYIAQDGQDLKPAQRQFPPMIPVTHHQKVATIDDETLYIGGLDLDQRRFDTSDHRREAAQTWHDVQLMVREPDLARAARAHLERFQREAASETDVTPPAGLLRTLSVKRRYEGASLSPQVSDTGILDRHLERIAAARRFIYLESQFFRDPAIAEALAARAEEVPDLGMVLVLPAAPLEVAFEGKAGLDQQFGEYMQAQCLDRITEAFGPRLFIGTPAQKFATEVRDRGALHEAPIIFVHSKVSIFDDASGMVSSANLNGRSMRWDTELGLDLDDAEQVRDLRQRVMSAWLPDDATPDHWAATPETPALWRDLAAENAVTAPGSRRGFILPYDIAPARALGRMLPGVPVEMV